jgi:hypothetical protein
LSPDKAHLATMERFTENYCKEAKFMILNEFNVKTGNWKEKLKISEKFTNFHQCPLFLSRSETSGMKVLTALVDGIAHNYNATLEFLDSEDTFTVQVPLQFSENLTIMSPINIIPYKKPSSEDSQERFVKKI